MPYALASVMQVSRSPELCRFAVLKTVSVKSNTFPGCHANPSDILKVAQIVWLVQLCIRSASHQQDHTVHHPTRYFSTFCHSIHRRCHYPFFLSQHISFSAYF